jgi:hypothetical protein
MALVLPLSCTECGAAAMAVRPGREEVRELFLLDAGEPQRCWCWDCWRAQFAQAEAAA